MMHRTNYPQDDPTPEPAARPRVGTRLWDKLDAIEAKIEQALGSAGGSAPAEDGDTKPTVTFEPEVDDLPTTASDDEEQPVEDGAGTGEGTTNLAYKRPPRHSFPHRRRVEAET